MNLRTVQLPLAILLTAAWIERARPTEVVSWLAETSAAVSA